MSVHSIHATVSKEGKFEFRKLLNEEQVANLKAAAPAFAKKLMSDVSALNGSDDKLKEPELGDILTPPTLGKEEKLSVFETIKDKIANPEALLSDLSKARLKFQSDVSEKLVKAEAALAAEEQKNELEITIAAQLEITLELLKAQLPADSTLAAVIEQIEAKLRTHNQRVLIRNAVVTRLHGAISLYKRIEDKH